MMHPAETTRRLRLMLKDIEKQIRPFEELKIAATTAEGRLTAFGCDFVFLANKYGVRPERLSRALSIDLSIILEACGENL